MTLKSFVTMPLRVAAGGILAVGLAGYVGALAPTLASAGHLLPYTYTDSSGYWHVVEEGVDERVPGSNALGCVPTQGQLIDVVNPICWVQSAEDNIGR